MLKIITVLVIGLASASMTLAAPVPAQFDDEELVAKLCGKLEQIESTPDKSFPGRTSGKYSPIKDATLIAYERHNKAECCTNSLVAAETTTSKSGAFEFKGLPNGYYWLVAKVEKKEYRMTIRVAQLKDKQPVCSQMSFAIDESGEFVLRIRVPGR
jgi:hypothetical protein